MKSDLLKVMGVCTMLVLPTAALANESEQPAPREGAQSLIQLAADEGKDKKGDDKKGDKKGGTNNEEAREQPAT